MTTNSSRYFAAVALRMAVRCSATGGCGKTFYATNLAYFLTHFTNKRVCIVDLDLQFGEVSTALRLRPKYTIFDALQREETDDQTDLSDHIEELREAGADEVIVVADPITEQSVRKLGALL